MRLEGVGDRQPSGGIAEAECFRRCHAAAALCTRLLAAIAQVETPSRVSDGSHTLGQLFQSGRDTINNPATFWSRALVSTPIQRGATEAENVNGKRSAMQKVALADNKAA